MIDTRLKGKVGLISGGNHGIGAATALALAEEGVWVFITFLRIEMKDDSREQLYRRKQAQNADETVKRIIFSGGKAEALELDLSIPSNIPLLFNKVEQRLGPVEILVNNAAYCLPDTFDLVTTPETSTGLSSSTFTTETHDQHFAVNSRAVALMMKEFLSRHVARKATWGRIINVSTDAADCFPTEISYGASKAALESFSRSAAVEFGKYGITVNIVAPGPIQTGWMSEEVEKIQARHSPLGRVGIPRDVADVIVFLASEQARWITGQRLFVGGGNRVV